MQYNIPIENIEELRKKAERIRKKGLKHGVEIIFNEIDEFVKEEENEDHEKFFHKYIVVEAEGVAKANGWIFAGTVEHTEFGNILRSIDDEHKIPERYRDAKPYCEHCNTMRFRKDTYIVYNEEMDEYKQVGKTCLNEYTNGLSVEMAALVLQWAKEIEESCNFTGGSIKKFWKVTEISKYFVETMRKLGWAGSSYGEDSTKDIALSFYELENKQYRRFPEVEKFWEKRAKAINFNKDNVSDEYITAALNWAKAWDNSTYNDYRDNLKIIAQMDYCEYKHLGYLASLFMTYDKEMEREIRRAETAKAKSASTHIGNIGDKVSESVKSWKCLSSWETQWGFTYLYEFINNDGNILIWKTSKSLEDVAAISGTIKAHNEYNGIKQTELTRCKVTAAN